MHESNLYPNDPFVTPDANGNPQPPADPFAPATPQPLPDHPITRAFSSKLFFSIAILYSIYTGLSFFIKLLFYQRLTLPLFSILAIIGLWTAYANAKATPAHMAITPDSVSFLSGFVKACRILCLVFSILCMLGGVAFAILSTMLNTPEACEVFVGEFQAFLFYFSTVAFPDLADPSLAPAIAGSLAFVFIVISLLLLFIGYFLFFKKAHRFIQSVKEYLKTGTLIENTSSLFVWLLVFGILMAIISVLSGLAVLYEGCSAAALILSAVWVHKYFS